MRDVKGQYETRELSHSDPGSFLCGPCARLACKPYLQ